MNEEIKELNLKRLQCDICKFTIREDVFKRNYRKIILQEMRKKTCRYS